MKNRFDQTRLYFLLLVLVWSTTGCSRVNKPDVNNNPNILIITLDNVGYGDLSVYNENSPIITPHIEEFARQGCRLTSFYTAGATCTVSRACLLTGRLPQRHKLINQLSGIYGNYGIGLRQSEILIPEILKNGEVEYATGAFGKWNIGFAPGSRPTERGFDEYLGIASGNVDHFSHVYAGKKDLYHNTESINREGEYSTDLFANAAIDFIETNKSQSRPWFVYLPFDAPTIPMIAIFHPVKKSSGKHRIMRLSHMDCHRVSPIQRIDSMPW